MTRAIPPSDLIPMDIFCEAEPILIDLVYQNAEHAQNIFKEAIYHSSARFWAHRDLAAVTLLSARQLHKRHGYRLALKDCLRTINAQTAMQKTKIVQENPQWCVPGPKMMVSMPKQGGHPRAMAIDVCVIDLNEKEVDMGTPFDHMDETSARNYTGFSDEILNNRHILEEAFVTSADKLGLPMFPLPSEWWDFRFPTRYFDQFAPLSDEELPPQMQMAQQMSNDMADFPPAHFEKLAESILSLIDKHNADI